MSSGPELSFIERFFGRPATRLGWWSIALASGFVVLLVVAGTRPIDPVRGSADDQILRALLVTAGACAVAGGMTSGIGIFVKRERSIVLFGTLLLGAAVLLFAAAEFFEGAANRRTPPAAGGTAGPVSARCPARTRC